MADDVKSPPDFKKRFRSAPYPSIPLEKAIGRAVELFEKAQHHTVPVHVPASAWGYTTKSGNLNSTISALKQFGLLRDEGSGDKRRFALTNDAIRIVNDRDPNSRKRIDAIKRAALAPRIHTELWEKFGVAGLSGSMDVSLNTHLTLDRKDLGEAPYSPSAADELVEEYKATIGFAGLTSQDIISGIEADGGDNHNLRDDGMARFGGVKVGDIVQWEVDGILKLEKPLRAVKCITHEGQEWVYVDGSSAAIPMNQLTVERREEDGGHGSRPPPLELSDPEGHQEWREVTYLDEGAVVLTMPKKLSVESYSDLETWMSFILAKAQRRSGVKKE